VDVTRFLTQSHGIARTSIILLCALCTAVTRGCWCTFIFISWVLWSLLSPAS